MEQGTEIFPLQAVLFIQMRVQILGSVKVSAKVRFPFKTVVGLANYSVPAPCYLHTVYHRFVSD